MDDFEALEPLFSGFKGERPGAKEVVTGEGEKAGEADGEGARARAKEKAGAEDGGTKEGGIEEKPEAVLMDSTRSLAKNWRVVSIICCIPHDCCSCCCTTEEC